jgi:ABC-type dipeptide/oligopeptide/nickel transport system ATPase subunit
LPPEHAVNCRVDNRDEVHRLDLEPHLTAHDTRDIEEIIDQLGLEPHVTLDSRDGLSGRQRIRFAAGEHMRPT